MQFDLKLGFQKGFTEQVRAAELSNFDLPFADSMQKTALINLHLAIIFGIQIS